MQDDPPPPADRPDRGLGGDRRGRRVPGRRLGLGGAEPSAASALGRRARRDGLRPRRRASSAGTRQQVAVEPGDTVRFSYALAETLPHASPCRPTTTGTRRRACTRPATRSGRRRLPRRGPLPLHLPHPSRDDGGGGGRRPGRADADGTATPTVTATPTRHATPTVTATPAAHRDADGDRDADGHRDPDRDRQPAAPPSRRPRPCPRRLRARTGRRPRRTPAPAVGSVRVRVKGRRRRPARQGERGGAGWSWARPRGARQNGAALRRRAARPDLTSSCACGPAAGGSSLTATDLRREPRRGAQAERAGGR